ncbi:MAG: hypothetical protein FWG02_03425 [Holophagaceae bacterium]|nr:hypothetical protein [Holophagaceae bacterium]
MDFKELSDWKGRLIANKHEIIEKQKEFKEREHKEYMRLMDEWARYRIEQEDWMKAFRNAIESGVGVDEMESLEEIELKIDNETEDAIAKYMENNS